MTARRAILLTAAFVTLAGILTVAALAAESLARRDLAWPLAPLNNWRAGAFRPAPDSASVDLDALADKARRDLPGFIAFVDDVDGEMLVVGPRDGSWNMAPLLRWRDQEGLPLLDPDPIGLGSSAPDWFSPARRAHDLEIAGGAMVVSAAVVALTSRRRRAVAR